MTELVNMLRASNSPKFDLSEWGLDDENPVFRPGYLTGLFQGALERTLQDAPPEISLAFGRDDQPIVPLIMEVALPFGANDDYVVWQIELEALLPDGIGRADDATRKAIASELRKAADAISCD